MAPFVIAELRRKSWRLNTYSLNRWDITCFMSAEFLEKLYLF